MNTFRNYLLQVILKKRLWLVIIVISYLAATYADGVQAGGIDFDKLPLSVQVVLTKINPLLQENDFKGAIEILQKFQARAEKVPKPGGSDPRGYHHPEIYFVLGNCRLAMEDYAAAAAAFQQAVSRDPDHAFAWLNLGKAEYELQHYTAAGQAFAKGYDTAKLKDPQYLYFSAAAHLMADDPAKSIEVFERLIALHPNEIKPLWREHLVQALLAVDKPRRALPHIRVLAQTYMGDKQIQWQEILLYHYLQLDMGQEALALAMELVRQAPEVAKWWKALTHIQLNAGRYEAALAALTVYSFCTPLTMEEKRLLADLNMQLGIPVKAVNDYESLLKDKPEKQLLLHLVQAYRQLGMADNALERIEAFADFEKDTELVLLKADLLYDLKRFDQAAKVYEQAARQNGDHSGRAWLMAGYSAWQIDDIANGRKAFTQATRYKNEKKAADEALLQLARLRTE